MSDEMRPVAVEPSAGATADPAPEVPANQADADESTGLPPEDVGWPGRGEPCA